MSTEPTPAVDNARALRDAIARARTRMREARRDRTITLPDGTTIDRHTIPVLGTRIFLDHPDAPADLRHAEIGAVTDGRLQLPGTEFGIGPATLRAIADILESEPDG